MEALTSVKNLLEAGKKPSYKDLEDALAAAMEERKQFKAAAVALVQRVNFAVTHLRCTGAGLLGNFDKPSSEWQHWTEYMADGIEMVPGLKVDREILATKRLPKAQARKEQAKILARRKVIKDEAAQ